ncbi:MAG: aminoacyl-tRNA hydrolase [Coriobacteriia bacterium]|nr:aminoacyl-tRNA hydrolase [Coriobacteriia bacterium]
MTRLVVGLGNPGREYASTRHNAGFLVIDLLGDDLRASYWKDQGGAKVAVVRFGGEDLVLAKPQTFMNLSGSSVKKLAELYNVEVAEIIVVHDDIDLAAGKVRVKRGGGHGGHNGLRSLHEQLDSDSYLRVRVGVGRPPGRMDAADYVLQPLKGAVFDDLEASIPTAAQAVISLLEHGPDATMQEFNAD